MILFAVCTPQPHRALQVFRLRNYTFAEAKRHTIYCSASHNFSAPFADSPRTWWLSYCCCCCCVLTWTFLSIPNPERNGWYRVAIERRRLFVRLSDMKSAHVFCFTHTQPHIHAASPMTLCAFARKKQQLEKEKEKKKTRPLINR